MTIKQFFIYGCLAGTWVEGELMPFTAGGDSSAGSQGEQDAAAGGMGWADPLDLSGAGARSSANAQRTAGTKALEATIEAAKIAAAAQREAQDKALAAQKEGTAQAIAAAKEAAQNANKLIANANLLVEKYTQEGIDFSNTEAAKSVATIKGIFKDTYDQNIAGFKQTYDNIKKEYADGYGSVEKTLAPWIGTGTKANAQLENLAGLNGAEAGKNALQTDPGYQFRVDQGQQALERSAAGKGNLFSGNTGVAVNKYGQDMATDEFTNVFNRLMALSEQGRAGSNALAGYKWNQTGMNAQNESDLNAKETNARSVYGQQGASLEDYLSKNKINNNWKLDDTRSQNALNAANTGTQGEWNISSATAGGAQNNALAGINAANRVGDTNINNAWAIQDAVSNQAYGNAAASIYENNQRKENAWNALDTAASLYGASKGGAKKTAAA